jgi:uncharacterized protein
MVDGLPVFKYHPDPVATGAVVASDVVCASCGKARGAVYVGPVYAEEELDGKICPWCIADGSAHEQFEAEFTDLAEIGGGEWDDVPEEIAEEVACQTPGFCGWQQERWFAHCGDAAAFLGRAGREELETLWKDALPAIRESSGLSGKQWEDFLQALDKDNGPTAYVFRCLHCGAYGGYQDCA